MTEIERDLAPKAASSNTARHPLRTEANTTNGVNPAGLMPEGQCLPRGQSSHSALAEPAIQPLNLKRADTVVLTGAAAQFEAQLSAALRAVLQDYRQSLSGEDVADQLQKSRKAMQAVHVAIDAYFADQFDQNKSVDGFKRTVYLDEHAAVLLECTRLLEAKHAGFISALRGAENWSALFAHLPNDAVDLQNDARNALLALEAYADASSNVVPQCVDVLKTQFVDMMVDAETVAEVQMLLSYQPALAPNQLIQFRQAQGLGSGGLSVEPVLASGEVDLLGHGDASVNLNSVQKRDNLGRPLGATFRINIPRDFARLNQQEVGLYRSDQGKLTTTGPQAISLYHEVLGHGLDIVRGQLPITPRDDGWTGDWEVSAIKKENAKRAVWGLAPRGAHEAYRTGLPLHFEPWQQRSSPNFYQSTAKHLLGEFPSIQAITGEQACMPLPVSDMRRTVTNTFSF